ncbi:class I SAM-dependent methyltransferase [Flagellimonas allohymeniacidonis]|uniref:Class I SAM-dependent methyltransferase n=1 Tax=Flagellimonas allohymeniacidonis TaxID=2517819 RepID=A0A4Q8QFR6_9FLAO|nr:methyltransferase domain-containing protein [Allomuricauda hymeniacidonis]TAI49291.1 class I SAM-dependent methyltransferase [Allomuricauda hymeniacidonis]
MKSEIISSWEKNAKEWVEVIQNQSIPSRKFTNRAILESISNLKVKKVADLGCGEGWLTREMAQLGIETTGFDAIKSLLVEASKKGPETYHQLTFEDIINGLEIPEAPFDAAIFNFCLYLKDNLRLLLENTLSNLVPMGHVLIQTLHPFFLIQNGFRYESQWLSDSWKGLPGNFKDGHSWYARTFEDWVNLLSALEDIAFEISEIKNDEEKPISLIIKIRKLK